MKKLIYFLLCFLPFLGIAQTETHAFTTYDTLIYSTYDPFGIKEWRLKITRPTNMFTNTDDSTSRQAIIFLTGQGQNGTNYGTLDDYGPHYWLNNGWDGSITTTSGTHYPIIISAISNVFMGQMQGQEAAELLYMLLNIYHIRRDAVHVMGFSQGAFAWSSSLYYERVPGDEFGMKQITSITCLQGVEETPTTSGALKASYKAWGHWANKYNGKAFCLEGTADHRNSEYMGYEFSDSGKIANFYLGYETDGGGNHCCWNDFTNPAITSWKSTPIYGTYMAAGPFTSYNGTYVTGDNIFTWMFKQGNTSFITGGGGGGTPVAHAGADQTLSNGTTTTTLNGSASIGTTFAWTRVSGPNTPTIVTASASTTNITGMVTGTYVFRLTVNSSLTDDITVVVAGSTYRIYDNTLDGIVITRTTYPTVTKGDTIYVPKKATGTGYNALIIANLFNNQIGPNVAVPGDWITIVFAPDCYMDQATSDNQYSYVDSIYGVKLVGFKQVNRAAQPFSFGLFTGPSHFIQHFWVDSFKVVNSTAFENNMYRNFPAMNGDTTKQHHHIYFTNGIIQKSYGWPTGAYSQNFIKLADVGLGGDDSVICRDIVIDNVTFDNDVSGNAVGGLTPGAGSFIAMGSVDSLIVRNCRFSNHGVNQFVSAHASGIGFAGNAHIYNNVFGPDNHNNEVRATGQDYAWHHVVGPVINIYNNLIISKRKYPAFELSDNAFTNPRLLAVRTIRRWFLVCNNGEYNGGIGAGGAAGAAWGNFHYDRKGVLDMKGSFTDSLTAKNNYALMPPRDSTSYTAACRVLIIEQAGIWTDTAKNFTMLTWPQAGLADSGNFVPSVSSAFRNYGASVPSFVSTRRTGGVSEGTIDVGPYDYQSGTNAPPGVEAGGNQSITLPVTLVVLAGSATDPDGTISTYAWTVLSKPTGAPDPTFSNSALAAPTVTNLTTAGTYFLRLTATDDDGATAYDDMTITVSPAPSNRRPIKILTHD